MELLLCCFHKSGWCSTELEAHGGEEKGNVDLLLGSEHTSVGLGVDQENMVANPASEAV